MGGNKDDSSWAFPHITMLMSLSTLNENIETVALSVRDARNLLGMCRFTRNRSGHCRRESCSDEAKEVVNPR